MKVCVTIRIEKPKMLLHCETLEAASTAEALRVTLMKPSVACHLQDLRNATIKAEALEVKE